MNNIFKIGKEATGESFLGRRKELRYFEKILYDNNKPGNISLVGHTLIGKSSLMQELVQLHCNTRDTITIFLCMAEYQNAFQFFNAFWSYLEMGLHRLQKWDDKFEGYFQILNRLDMQTNSWYNTVNLKIKAILEGIKQSSLKVVLIIDGFDDSPKVFNDTSYFQFMRTIYSSAGFSVGGVLISRRRLDMIEHNANGISSFHGVFDEYILTGFDDDSMDEFYAALSQYNIFLDDPPKERLMYYCGRIPYLYCMFANHFVNDGMENITSESIDNVFFSNLPQINRYYNDLLHRIREDGQLDELTKILFMRLPKTEHDRIFKTMEARGYLYHDTYMEEDTYYAFCRDFMVYLNLTLNPLDIPTWGLIMKCEKHLKNIFRLEYQHLDDFNYLNISENKNETIQQIDRLYPDLNLDMDKIYAYCRDLNAYKPNPTITDVLTLGFIINIILNYWDSKFYKYFNRNKEYWTHKLETISRLRKPLAHAYEDYVSDDALAECNSYCIEILNLSIPAQNK